MRAEHRYALTALVLGLCAVGISIFLTRSSIWQPLTLPVNLQHGATQSQPFTVGISADYLVELEADRAMPFEQLNCLLGIDTGTPIQCDGVASVELTWQVTSSNPAGIVAEGNSGGPGSGAWSDTVSRTLGSFPAKKGDEYVLKVVSTKNGSALMPANPRVVVRQHPLQSKSTAVAAQLLFWFGIVVVVVALVLLVFRHSRLRNS